MLLLNECYYNGLSVPIGPLNSMIIYLGFVYSLQDLSVYYPTIVPFQSSNPLNYRYTAMKEDSSLPLTILENT